MEFKDYLMEDVLSAIIDYRGKTPKKSESGIPTLSAKSVKNNYINYSECYYISEDEYKRFMVRGFPEIGDILLTTEAPMGMVARLDRDDVAIAQRLLTLRGKEGVLDNDYLLYILQSPYGQGLLKAKETGTTVTGIKQAEFRKIVIKLPGYDVQKKISGILRTIDSKILCNTNINDNLQQQIKMLVTAWLVDYVPFGGMMPSDWHSIPLSTIANFVSGYSYKGAELQASTTAMATIKNFDRNGGFKLDGFKELVPSSKIKPCHYAEKFDVVVAHTDLTQKAEVIGNAEPIINLSGYEAIVFSMDLVKVVPKDTRVSKFMLAALLQNPRFKAHCLGYVNGTTVLHLSKKALPDYELDFPTDPSVLAPLDDALRVLYMQMATIVDENRKLQDLRDTLLPQLMRGEIDVSGIDA